MQAVEIKQSDGLAAPPPVTEAVARYHLGPAGEEVPVVRGIPAARASGEHRLVSPAAALALPRAPSGASRRHGLVRRHPAASCSTAAGGFHPTRTGM